MTLKELNNLLNNKGKITLVCYEAKSILEVETSDKTLKYHYYDYYDYETETHNDTKYKRKELVKTINNGLDMGYQVL